MITGSLTLTNYSNWKVRYFILAHPKGADTILQALFQTRCSSKFMRRAERLLRSNRLNKGLTYSRPFRRETIVVISKATDIGEFFNTFAHEIDHIEKHVAKALGFSPYSERASYLVGEIVREMIYTLIKKYYVRTDRNKRFQRTRILCSCPNRHNTLMLAVHRH